MKHTAMRVLVAARVVIIFAALGCSATIDGSGMGPGGQGPGAGSGGAAGTSGATGGEGGGGNSGTGGEMRPGDGGTFESGTNCLQLRRCIAACKDDACVQGCFDLSSPAGHMLFDQLLICSKAACPDQKDLSCRCQAECIFPGPCTDLQDMCADGVADPYCEMCA